MEQYTKSIINLLETLEEKEIFIKDIQAAFKKAAVEEFGDDGEEVIPKELISSYFRFELKDGKTVIGKGGYLLREEDVDIRQNFHDKVIKEILEDNK